MTHHPRIAVTVLLALTVSACADAPTAPAPTPAPAPAPAAAQAQATAQGTELATLNSKNGFTPFQVEFNDDFLCAGNPDVWTSLTGQVKVASVSPRPGGGVRIVEILSRGQITLAGNGKTLSSALAGTVVYEINANDQLERITFPGSNGVFTAPGWGRILAETGHPVMDGSGNIISEAGPHDVFGSNPNAARLCAYLRS